jgi:predicted PurR-regulated permease PerM
MNDLDNTARMGDEVKTTNQKIQGYFLIGMLVLSIILVFLIFRPYIPVLLFAFVLAIIFQPVYKAILNRIGKHTVVASILTTLVVVLLIILPVAVFSSLVFRELTSTLPHLSFADLSNIKLPSIFQNRDFDLQSYVTDALNSFAHNLGTLLSDVVKIFVFLGLTILTLIYFFKDGEKIANSAFNTLPFTKQQAQKLRSDLTIGVRAVIGGHLLVAMIQGTLTGIGLWIFGVPNPALWGFLAVIAALVPTFGSSLVNIPAAIFLFANGNTGAGIGLLIWYVLAVSLIDNFIGPKFISGRINIHVLLIIFSIIGGLQFFGPIGFILGPLVTIFAWSIFEMFQGRNQDHELQQPAEINLKLDK